jgi:hypothetical protein
MKPIKSEDHAYVIMMMDGTYWIAGGFANMAILTTVNLSSATFLPYDDAFYKANKLREIGRMCVVHPIIIALDY